MQNWWKSLVSVGALVVALGVPVTGQAADSAGTFVTEGPGRLTCVQAFGETATPQDVQLVTSWLTGYMSAQHQLLTDTFDLTPWQSPSTMVALLRQYCTATPDGTVVNGAQQLVRYLAPQRLEEAAQIVSRGEGERRIVMYDVVLERVREKLVALGHTTGPTWPDFEEGVRDFQATQDIPQNGLLDQITLSRLLQ